MQKVIGKLIEGQHLEQAEAREVMDMIMSGQVTPAQIAAFITAMRMKGETAEEVAGCASAMRGKADSIRVPHHTVDTCGTGGDRMGTFNISTTAAFVVAGAGVPVAKHGNRSVSSKSGSADVLEALGVNIELAPHLVEETVRRTGIGFLFAQRFHPAMSYAAGPRRELGFRSIFNLLGPLTNPAGTQFQLIGVYRQHLTEVVARSLLSIGMQRAMVVHGSDGMDELTLTGVSFVSEVHDGMLKNYQVDPEQLGLRRCSARELAGGSAAENAAITLKILTGEERGPKRQVVLLNAAAALCMAGEAKNLQEGLAAAAEVIDGGLAQAKLEQMVKVTGQLAAAEQVCLEAADA